MKSYLPVLFLFSSFAIAEDDFRPRQVIEKPFEAITNPNTVDILEAGKWVNEDELVLGIVVGDEARAYPINMLTRPTREIINDELGGRSIAATW